MKFTHKPTVKTTSNPHCPLSALVEFGTDRPANATLDIADGEMQWSIRFDGEFKTEHTCLVLGLRPNRTHHIGVKTVDAAGDTTGADVDIEIITDPLPADFPSLEVIHCIPKKRDPGLILFSVRHSPASKHLEPIGLIFIVDREGDVVWYYRVGCEIGDVRRLRNGNLMYATGDHRIVEIDMLGNIVRQWYAAARQDSAIEGGIPLDMEAIHHTIIELPSRNLAALGIEIRQYPNYPASDSDPRAPKETANVVGDVLVEFRPDGTIENRWSMLDILDPYRMCYGTLGGYWITRGFPDTRDWSHANGVAYDAADDSFVISLRRQDAVVKISRKSRKLIWILGPHGGWNSPWTDHLLDPHGDLEWAFHQHDPSITPQGTIMLFDNGNHRALPPYKKMAAADSYSRAVEFAVDGRNRTVTQVWSFDHGGVNSLFATYQGGVLRLPKTGNVFINYGGIVTDMDGKPSNKNRTDHCSARLVEIEYEPPHEKVFEMVIDDQSGIDPVSWSSFRTEYLPSLYP
jgi:hypothetical protein